MEKKYYLVEAKCGHVGRNMYIVKTFAIIAESRKEASSITRFLPRVKHDDKYAIISCTEVSCEAYQRQRDINAKDPYFTAKNKQGASDIYELINDESRFEENSRFIERDDIRVEKDEKKTKNGRASAWKMKTYVDLADEWLDYANYDELESEEYYDSEDSEFAYDEYGEYQEA